MNNTEQHYLHLIEMERAKIRPGIDRNELAEIEFELKRLKGLLLQHRQGRLKKVS